ncbi:MAG: TPM domain-containing protein, partial [Chitinivibrionales bacterium]|nr:TPM domain-containing protein [Chitinivibrionales bacterium]
MKKTSGKTIHVSLSKLGFVLILLVIAIASQTVDILSLKPRGPVNDFAGILSEGTKQTLSTISISLYNKTGVSLVLATISSLNGHDIDDVTNRLYEKWGIGNKKNDEGIFIVLAVEERMIRFETGYGSEGYFTDAIASSIRQEASKLYLSKNQWDNGLSFIVNAAVSVIAKEKNAALTDILPSASTNQFQQTVRYPSKQQQGKLSFFQIVIIMIVLLIMISTRTGRMLLMYILLSSGHGRHGTRHGGFGGGFGGGGFGGFGGGRSGGGGSSGG